MPGRLPTAVDMLNAELAAAKGPLCGWTSVAYASVFSSCARAANHAGAQILTDVHLCRDGNGALVAVSEEPPMAAPQQVSA